jgi:hypothetical protein
MQQRKDYELPNKACDKLEHMETLILERHTNQHLIYTRLLPIHEQQAVRSSLIRYGLPLFFDRSLIFQLPFDINSQEGKTLCQLQFSLILFSESRTARNYITSLLKYGVPEQVQQPTQNSPPH